MIRALRDEGTVHVVDKGATARWAIAEGEPATTSGKDRHAPSEHARAPVAADETNGVSAATSTLDAGDGTGMPEARTVIMTAHEASGRGGRMVAAALNGTAGAATHDAPHAADGHEPTAALVAAFEAARSALAERRRELAAELSTIEATLAGGTTDTEPGPEPEGGASARVPPSKRRGRPPSSTSRASRVLAFVGDHPGVTTREIARALRRESGEVAGVLFELRRSGRVQAAGARPHTTWTAASA